MSWSILKRGSVFAAAIATTSMFAGSAFADVGDFLGNWVNTDSDTSGITRILVTPAGGGHVKIRVFGQCTPVACDWGVRPGHSYAESPGSSDVRSITAQFNTGFANTLVILRRAPGGDMRFEVLTDFTDGSGRNDYDMTGHLTHGGPGGWPGGWPGGGGPGGWPGGGGPGGGPGGGGPGGGPGGGGPGGGPGGGGMAEDCISFNPATSGIAFVGGAWKFVDGSNWILDFGSNHGAAVAAGNVISYYHFDQLCYVVRPGAQMTYWKRSGHVPSNNMSGQDCNSFNPATVHSQFAGGAWKVASGGSWMLDYGSNHAAADQAVATIQNYNLNRQCFVARPNPPMSYWLSQ